MQLRATSFIYKEACVAFDTTRISRKNGGVTREMQFDWDQWNVQRNELKHDVRRLEAESAFFDPQYKLYQDARHSAPRGARYILYGRSIENRMLMLGFTVRGARIRVITARIASRRERRVYEGKESKQLLEGKAHYQRLRYRRHLRHN